MHRLIKFRRTGHPEVFARKMGMSLSGLYGMLKELKTLGAPISYCRFRESYVYVRPTEFFAGFRATELNDQELKNIRAAGKVIPLWTYPQRA